jgi:heme exporter protein C
MSSKAKLLIVIFWVCLVALFAVAGGVLLYYTPTESTMGSIQKVFYVHLPVAINTFFACLTVFVASVGYLWQRKTSWDDLAASAAKVAVLLCSIVLLTGMIWGRGAWGRWWTWSPRLTFSLMLWLLYVVYLIIRNSVDSAQRRATISAVYGIIAFLDVPLVYLSARLMPDIHPASIQLDPSMKLTLAVWFVPVTLGAIGMVILRYVLARLETQRQLETAAEAAEPSQSISSRPKPRMIVAKKATSATMAEASHD